LVSPVLRESRRRIVRRSARGIGTGRSVSPGPDALSREPVADLGHQPVERRQRGDGEDARLAGLKSLAAQKHIDLAQVVLAWLLARSPVMLAIPGTTKIEHLEDNVAAGKVRLTKDEMERIEKLG